VAGEGRRWSNVVAFDDGPFDRDHRGDVPLVGAVFARHRLDGVLVGRVRRDGANATSAIVELLGRSQFREHVQAVLLQGIALAGFNVVDLPGLHEALGIPVVVVARRAPDLAAIRRVLLERVPGGRRKWALVERAGPMEPVGPVWVQRVGIAHADVERMLAGLTIHGVLPEPIRAAHLIAGALVTGVSRGRA
jgi:endonuclease V-like protein UPF0215 family